MRILYGVQGTGNGHITRARSMARALTNSSLQVDYLFSGRPRDKYFNTEPFGKFRSLRGLTFCWNNGRLDYLKTALRNDLCQFMRDVKQLDLSGYDLVVTDFEPISAWAAKKQRIPSLGIGHQYAFKSPQVPTAGHSLVGSMVLKHFAPADRTLGFHWHHFNSAILPPLIERPCNPLQTEENKILVYLPFENRQRVIECLSAVKEMEFYIYCDVAQSSDQHNIHLRPFERDTFQRSLTSCGGVITNAGFGLLSEAIQAGKKLLVKPMQGQMEQLSNAAAIEELGIGEVMHELNLKQLREWLDEESPGPRPYPDVAQRIVDWIESGFSMSEKELAEQLWSDCLQFQFASDDEVGSTYQRASASD